MTKNIDIINVAVSLVIKAAILAAGFSGRVRKRSLKRLAAMDVDSKDISSGRTTSKSSGNLSTSSFMWS